MLLAYFIALASGFDAKSGDIENTHHFYCG